MRDLSIEEIKAAADPVAACKEQIRCWKISYSRDPGSCGAIDMAHLEFLLQSVEILQGRKFVDGSIKHYELVKEG